MSRLVRVLVAALVASLCLAGCAVGKDAVVEGSSFSFVSPGGKLVITYPEAQRQVLPNLTGQSLEDPNRQIHVSDYPGKVVVLNIWGQWCGPCRDEAPELSSVFQQTRAQGVQLLGIDVRDQRSAALDFVHDNQISYPSIFDPAGRSLLALSGYPRAVVPSTIVLDRQHRVAAVYLERVTATLLLPEVQTLASKA
ncbi:MAG TPA: TlpA disulfide reductase family protein [Pseudonocardiaceae bacterium]|nr:TlpA disulfide reductase family protein [Pseudonocardiaceae bacterium]